MRAETGGVRPEGAESGPGEPAFGMHIPHDQGPHSALNAQHPTPDTGPTGKERRIADLFARVAPKYDLINAVMSFGLHQSWRRRAAKLAALRSGDCAVDVCCGTGDLARAARERVGKGGVVIGVDICPAMLAAAVRRTPELVGRMVVARAEALPLRTGCAGAALTGFSMRNVSDVRAAISEMSRAVRPGGRVVILETASPRPRVVRPFWRFYMRRIVPKLARLFGAPADAYEYFEQSVREFRTREELAAEMAACGLVDVTTHDLALGAVCVHTGVRNPL